MTNIEDLSTKISACVSEMNVSGNEFSKLTPREQSILLVSDPHLKSAVEAISKEILKHEKFQSINEQYLSCPGQSTLLNSEQVSRVLVVQVLLGGNANIILERLEEFFSKKTEDVSYLIVAYGARISSRIEVNSEIDLIPGSEFSEQVKEVTFNELKNEAFLDYRNTFGIVIRVPNGLRLVEGATKQDGSFGLPEDKDLVWRDVVDAGKSLSSLVACYEKVPIVTLFTRWLADDKNLLADVLGGTSYPLREGQLVNPSNRGGAISEARLVKGIQQYLRLDDLTKKGLEIPMHRFTLSLRRWQTVDQVIDLGIAFEALFLNNEGGGELTEKLSMRVAKYVGTGLEERREIRKNVKDFYKARSTAVHSGIIAEKNTGASEIASEYFVIALRKIIDSGTIPDWTDLLLDDG